MANVKVADRQETRLQPLNVEAYKDQVKWFQNSWLPHWLKTTARQKLQSKTTVVNGQFG